MKRGNARQALLAAAAASAFAPLARAQVTFSINEGAGQTAISPYIYGVNATLNPSNNLTFTRAGGNRWTAYNYTNNLSNAGSDYYYENDTFLGGGNTPAGAVLPTVQNAQASSAGVLLTVPMNGWVAGQVTAPLAPGTKPTAPPSEPNYVPEFPTQAADPAPASNHVYENGFVQIIKNAWAANPTGILAFDLDNEPDLWNSTHQEVHPTQTTYAELVSDSVAYATMIKQVDPQALVYGPVSYGWEGFETLQGAPDSAKDGPFLAYYLKSMAAASSTAGTRLLDALDLHWYPEATGGGNRITDNGTSAAEIAARLQAPRSLWDPTYVENSWITQDTLNNTGIDLIPREQATIAANYPGTKLSFSEYDYGAGSSISGGVAEADVLGIFGKYGVYSANQWPTGDGNDTFVAGAFAMFRNYDGKKDTFGDTEVQANNTDTVNSSVYASIDSKNPGHLTLIVINKEATAYTANLNIADGGNYTTAGIYTLTSASPNPVFAGNMALANPTSFSYSMPAYSVSTISLTLAPLAWGTAGGGSWGTAANWAGGKVVPQHAGQVVNFAGSILGNSSVTLNGNETVGGITFSNSFSYAILPGSGGKLTLDNGINTVAITDSAGTHTLGVPLLLNSNAAVTVTNAGDKLTLAGNVSGTAGLTIAGAGTVALATGTTLNAVGSLTMAAGATLDMTNSGLAINFGSPAPDPMSTVKTALASGYNGGAWTGKGIVSSTAAAGGGFSIGYADGNTDTGTPAAANQVMVAYTLAGDALLSGSVGFSDLVIVARNFGATGRDWSRGNFTYDPAGSVGFADLVLVAQNFGRSAAIAQQSPVTFLSPLWQAQSASVMPEPGTLGILGALGLLGRRRQRGK